MTRSVIIHDLQMIKQYIQRGNAAHLNECPSTRSWLYEAELWVNCLLDNLQDLDDQKEGNKSA